LKLHFFATRRRRVPRGKNEQNHPTDLVHRNARFFLVQTYQKGKNIPKDHKQKPNGHTLYQMSIKYTHIFHSKTLQNIPKLEFFGLKINHLGTLLVHKELIVCKVIIWLRLLRRQFGRLKQRSHTQCQPAVDQGCQIFLVQHTKNGKIHQITVKYTK
jgi:hypothetical protein